MSTPFDGKIYLVNWKARNTPGENIADCARLIRQKMPNVSGIMLKCSNGTAWQGEVDDFGPQAITSAGRVKEWVDTFAEFDLEVHIWGVPRGKRPTGGQPNLPAEAEKLILAGRVEGVKSVGLDIEHGRFYWQGSADEASELMTLIKAGLPEEMHLFAIMDGRRNRPFDRFVDPWIPFMDSLHLMVYPVMFGRHKTIEEHIDSAFKVFEPFGKPLVPMLQSVAEMGGRPSPAEITRQGQVAFDQGAAGISFFRLGNDNWSGDGLPFMGQPEYEAVARIRRPELVFPPDYSWKEVIQATAQVAGERKQDWRSWFAQAGVWNAFSDFLDKTAYSGPALSDWPLEEEMRQELLQRLAKHTGEQDESSGGG